MVCILQRVSLIFKAISFMGVVAGEDHQMNI